MALSRVGVVIVCAGEGRRLKGLDKPVLNLKDKPLFSESIGVFEGIKAVKQIVLVLRKEHFALAKKSIRNKYVNLVEGGKERSDSVINGLLSLDKDIDYVLIHDGARPFIERKIILDILKKLEKHPAVVCGVNSPDTVKLIKSGYVEKTLDRKKIFLAQTPQGFKKSLIIKAHRAARGKNVTDDAQMVELIGRKVKIVLANSLNIKITYSHDLKLAKAISCGKA